MKKIVNYFVIALAVAMIAAGVAGIVSKKISDDAAQAAYDEIASAFTEAQTEAETAVAATKAETETEPETEAETEAEPVVRLPEDGQIGFLQFDWSPSGYLTSGYPIMFNGGDDDLAEDYWLHRDINGEESTAGSIYLDSHHNIYESGLHTVYGHRMRNKTMFRDIADMVDANVMDQVGLVHIYTDEGEITLKPVACYAGAPDGDYRQVITDSDELSAFLFEKTGKVIETDNVYVFITCSYGADGLQDERTYLICVEV